MRFRKFFENDDMTMVIRGKTNQQNPFGEMNEYLSELDDVVKRLDPFIGDRMNPGRFVSGTPDFMAPEQGMGERGGEKNSLHFLASSLKSLNHPLTNEVRKLAHMFDRFLMSYQTLRRASSYALRKAENVELAKRLDFKRASEFSQSADELFTLLQKMHAQKHLWIAMGVSSDLQYMYDSFMKFYAEFKKMNLSARLGKELRDVKGKRWDKTPPGFSQKYDPNDDEAIDYGSPISGTNILNTPDIQPKAKPQNGMWNYLRKLFGF